MQSHPAHEWGPEAHRTGVRVPSGSGTPLQVGEGEEPPRYSKPVEVAVSLLRFYKKAISPLIPPSCRYQPTCSMYSIAAYQEFGFWKGSALTAFRLLRCQPWGGRGYDPPQWPPVWR